MKRVFLLFCCLSFAMLSFAQNEALKKVYNEEIDPMPQIDNAVNQAAKDNKYVICQVGGNWCIWCLRFADFITKDSEIAQVVKDNFEYIHVNYNPSKKTAAKPGQSTPADLMKRLDNCGRFGFPVFVVLDQKGRVIHIQDSSFLEEGKGYNKEKVMRFFQSWTPKAVEKNVNS